MATITLSATADSGPSVSASVTISDADLLRMVAQLPIALGNTPEGVMTYILGRLMEHAVSITARQEQIAATVVPILAPAPVATVNTLTAQSLSTALNTAVPATPVQDAPITS